MDKKMMRRLEDNDAEIARLKAALEAERAACDEWRDIFKPIPYANGPTGAIFKEERDWWTIGSKCRLHDARRSAERAAQENGR